MGRGVLLLTAATSALGAATCYLVMLPAYTRISLWAAIWWGMAGTGQFVLAYRGRPLPSPHSRCCWSRQ